MHLTQPPNRRETEGCKRCSAKNQPIGCFLFLAAFLLGEMTISPSTPLWCYKVNQFPEGFPNPVLYCTGYNKPLTYNLSASLSDSSCLERIRGAISPATLFSFLKTRIPEEFPNSYGMFVMAKIPQLSFRFNGRKVKSILWRAQRLTSKKNYFLYMMKCMGIVSIDYFGRAAMRVAQGLKAAHSTYTMCTQPWHFKATLIPSE